MEIQDPIPKSLAKTDVVAAVAVKYIIIILLRFVLIL